MTTAVRRAGAAALTLLTSAAATLAVALAPSASASVVGGPLSTAKVNCVAVAADGSCSVTGVVYAVTQVGDRTYIGGRFTSVNGAPRANVAAVRADGTLDPAWTPSTNGVVYALAPSSDGSRIFLGGGFTTVDGQSRSRLAAVTSDTGALVAGWTTSVNNNLVRALAADGGDRLYVGGSFGLIGGRSISRLGAVSQSTGVVDRAFVPAPDDTVRGLALSDDGSDLYAVGPFKAIGGQPRPGAAELGTATGAATAFAPAEGGVAIAVDISSSGRLFFATTNNRTWAYDVDRGGVAAYRVRTSGDVQAIQATDDEVYIGGHFSGLPEAQVNRLHIASFRTADGSATSWNPGVNGEYGVWALGLTRTPLSSGQPSRLSVGGDFTVVGGLARRGYARFALSS